MRSLLVTIIFAALAAVSLAQDESAWSREGLLTDLPSVTGQDHQRESSTDPQGANNDFRPIQPGETLTIFDQAGPGRILRFWCTLDSKEEDHLRKIVLRIYWDGEQSPSVNTPLGDFFGLGHGAYYHYTSAVMNAAVGKGMSCFLPMPFANRARIEIENQGEKEIRKFYWQIDWERMPEAPPEDFGRLHAQWNRENPTTAAPNTGPEEAYKVVEARGKGRYIGMVLSVHGLSPQWWGEGDEIIELDGRSIVGTGLEDYFNCAWGFGQPFWAQTFGAPYVVPKGGEPEKATVYRWDLEDPYYFTASLKVLIEHGTQNDRADDYSSVAYWYQVEPHEPFELAPVADRLPMPFNGDIEEPSDTESVEIEGAPAIEIKTPRIVPPTYDEEESVGGEGAALKMVLLAGWLPAILLGGGWWYLKGRKR